MLAKYNMDTLFRTHKDLLEEEYQTLWEKGLFVFDAKYPPVQVHLWFNKIKDHARGIQFWGKSAVILLMG